MVLTSSRWIFMSGVLVSLGIGGAMLVSAWQQTNAGSPIPPLGTVGVALACFLIGTFLVYSYFINEKPNAVIIRFPVFFVGLIWVVCFGVTAESFVGAHLWRQGTAIAEQVVASVYRGGRKGNVYTDRITYRYVFQGKTFTGYEVLSNSDRIVNKPLHGNQRLSVGPIVAGEQFYIRLNPAYPDQSFIQRRVRYIPFLLLLFSTFLLGKWVKQKSLTQINEKTL